MKTPSPLGVGLCAAFGMVLSRVAGPILAGLTTHVWWQVAPWLMLVAFWVTIVALVRRPHRAKSG